MSYSNSLLIYSNSDLHESYISDKTAANVVSYMNASIMNLAALQ